MDMNPCHSNQKSQLKAGIDTVTTVISHVSHVDWDDRLDLLTWGGFEGTVQQMGSRCMAFRYLCAPGA